MDTLKIGQIIKEPQSRDAVHMAIVPVKAGQLLSPGNHVGLIDGYAVPLHTSLGTKRRSLKLIGVVDPFLTNVVGKGDKFWLFLYPGSITSLRHAWTHPEFADDLEAKQKFMAKQQSKVWLQDFCVREELDYSYLVEHESVGNKQDLCDSLVQNTEFAEHFRVVTGRECPDYFSCAC